MKKFSFLLSLGLLVSVLAPVSFSNALSIANVYTCNSGDTNGGGTLATCTHTVQTGTSAVSPTVSNSSSITNLIPNPSFEGSAGVTGWQQPSNTTLTGNTVAKFGSYGLVMTSIASGDIASRYGYSTIPVSPSTVYTFSIYAKSASTTRNASAILTWYNSSSTFLSGACSSSSYTSVSPSSWVRMFVTCTSPSTAAYANPQITIYSTASSGESFYVDGALFTTTSTVYPYFDGSYSADWSSYVSGISPPSNSVITSANTNWNGTANASSSYAWYQIATCSTGYTYQTSGTYFGYCTQPINTVTTYSGTLVTTQPTTYNTTYTCPSGYVSSGTGTSTICTASVLTYHASSAYSCTSPSVLTSAPSTPAGYVCITAGSAINATATTTFGCNSGDTVNSSTGLCTTSASSIPATLVYSCLQGGTRSGTTCTISSSTYSSNATTTYTCPSGGGDLYGHPTVGTTCITASTTKYVTPVTETTTCPSGYTLQGTATTFETCYKASYSVAPTTTFVYQCTGVNFYNSTTCVYDGYQFPASLGSVVSCPTGSNLTNPTTFATCTYPVDYQHPTGTTFTYTCPSGYSSTGAGQVTGGVLQGQCVLPSSSYTATATTTYLCNSFNDVLSGDHSTCTIPGSTYTATSSFTCSGGITPFGGNCIVYAGSYPEVSTVQYSCSGSYSLQNGTSCVSASISTTPTLTQSCTGSDTLSGNLCTVVSGTTSYVLLYTGSCITNFQLNPSTGACNLVGSGITSTTTGQWFCTSVASSTADSITFTSAYDATASDGLGSYISCQLQVAPTLSIDSGLYLCTSTDYTTGSILSYTSTVDASGVSVNANIVCVYTGDVPIDLTPTDIPTFAPTAPDPDPCDSVDTSFLDYVQCLGNSI